MCICEQGGYDEAAPYKQAHSRVRQASIFTLESQCMINFCNGVTAICPARLSGSMRCWFQSQLWQLSSEDEKQPSVSVLLEGKRDADAYPARLLRLLGRSVWVGSGNQEILYNCKMVSLHWRILAEMHALPNSAPEIQCGLSELLLFRNIAACSLQLAFWASSSSWEGVRDAIGAPPASWHRIAASFTSDQTIFPECHKDQFLDTWKTYYIWMSQAIVYNEETKRKPLI